MSIADRYELREGWLWPKADKGAWEGRGNLIDCVKALDHVREFDVAVQAGGNCGWWPKYLAQRFKRVYTFEPDPVNFVALVFNCPEDNIIKIQAGLGKEPGFAGMMEVARDNRGMMCVHENGSGRFPILPLDTFGFKKLDFLQLDVEGYESHVLLGALETIKRCRPVIMFEDKMLDKRYGKVEHPMDILEPLGYRLAEIFWSDKVLIHG